MPAPTRGEGPPSGRGDRPAPLPSGPVGARPPSDGLFEERTELAWTRSGVAILLVVAVIAVVLALVGS